MSLPHQAAEHIEAAAMATTRLRITKILWSLDTFL